MEQTDGTQALGFKDRKTGLLVFGILQITLGGAGAVLMLFATINMIVSPILNESPARPVSAAALAIWYFCAGAFLAVWSVWTGVGSIKARRWARVLILASSWIELIGMICEFVLQLLLMPVPRGESVFTRIDWLVLPMTIFELMIPGAFVFFYRSKNVKATCELRDSQTRWNDQHPWLLVVAIVLYGVHVISRCIMTQYYI